MPADFAILALRPRLMAGSLADLIASIGTTQLASGRAEFELAPVCLLRHIALNLRTERRGGALQPERASLSAFLPGWPMKLLRLIAFDEDDLKILSAHLQDALLRVEDMAFLPKERRFAAVLKRFDWIGAQSVHPPSDRFYERREAALRFDRVLSAKVRQLDLTRKGEIEELLAVNFEPLEPPSGYVDLIFAGGGAIRLHVECLEGELRDLGPVWRTRRKPDHTGALSETRTEDGGSSQAASG